MKIRSALGALSATLAVTAGLLVFAGTANADTTCVPSIAGVTPAVNCPSVTVTTTPVTTTPVPTTTPTPLPCVDPVGRRCHDHGDGDGFHGHYLDLGGVGPLDVCPYGTYDQFAGHYSLYRDRFDRVFGGNPYSRWNQLHVQCVAPAPPVVVANDGQCVTFRTQAIQYGNGLNDSRRFFNDQLQRYRGLHGYNDSLLTPSEIYQLRQDRAIELARSNDWNRGFGQLRTVCQQSTPPVQIINEAPAPQAVTCGCTAPATTPAPTVVEAPPTPQAAPLTTSGPYKYPSVAPQTGDGSLAR